MKTKLVAITLAMTIGLPVGAWAQGAPARSQTADAQVQQPSEGGVNWPGVGYGAAALLGNVLYMPAKLAYAVVGSVAGGAGYVLTAGNTQTSDTIWRSSLGGDYVLTPEMVKGKQPIHFSGPTTTPPAALPVQPKANSIAAAPAPYVMPNPPSMTASGIGPSEAATGTKPTDPGSGPVKERSKLPLPSTTIE